MRELHVIGLSPDGLHLLLAASDETRKPSHRIAVDARFEAALRGQRLDDAAPGPVVSPRDIQARLRAGATVEEVALQAGLPASRVRRFAGPVLSEREDVLRRVYAARQSGRRGTSSQSLQIAVATALAQLAFTKPETLAWTAYRRVDGAWVAKVSIVVRGRTKSAEWSLDTTGTSVRPLDAWASSLGHVEPVDAAARRRAAPRGKTPAPKAEPPKASAAKAVVGKAAPAGAAPVKAVAVKAAAVKVAPAEGAPATAAPSHDPVGHAGPAA